MFGYLLILILFVLVIVFAVQNAGVVAVSFLFWKFQASLSILIVIFFTAGVISTILVYLIGRIKPRAAEKKAESGGNIPQNKTGGYNGISK